MDTSCHLDGTLFPFDSQSCSIVLESWAHSEAYMDLHNASNFVHLDGFNDDGLLRLGYQITKVVLCVLFTARRTICKTRYYLRKLSVSSFVCRQR